jgi:SAM-dependent methyltransferase
MKQMNCAVCHSQETAPYATVGDPEYFTSEKTYTYLQCLGCGLIFLPYPPVAQLSVIYPKSYYSNSEVQKGSVLQTIKNLLERKFFMKILDRIPGATLSALDIGGGTGWILQSIKLGCDRIQRSVIVDFSTAAETQAKKAGHEYHRGRIEDFPDTQKFDFILMLNLIEHVDSPRAVLEKISRILTPNGVVVVKTPNADTWERVFFRNRYWGGLHSPRHWNLFNEENFRRLAQECGLRIQAFHYTQGAPQLAASILGSLPALVSKKSPMDRQLLYKVLLMLGAAFDFLRRPFFRTGQMFILLSRSASS